MTEPDPGLPLGQPGIYVPVPDGPVEPVTAPPRRSIVLPAVLAVALFLAAGAFVALWLIERGDHKTTTGQLGGVRTEIAEMEKKTVSAQTAYTDTEAKLKQAEAGLAEKQAAADKDKPCSDVGHEFNKAAETGDDRALDAALRLVLERCK